MNKIYLLLILGAGLSCTRVVGANDNPQELLNSIEITLERAVGAKISDQIPGYSYGDDHVTLNTGGIECPKNIIDVKRATDLLKAKLSSTFTNQLVSIRSHSFPPGDDTVVVAKMRAGNQEVVVSITIFKRSSSRVMVFPVMVSKSTDK